MKDANISIRLERRFLDKLNHEYSSKKLYNTISFSEFIRQKLKEGETK